MTTEQKILYIAVHYGYKRQSRQLIEAMAKLTVAINAAWRETFDKVDELPNMEDEECIEEEIASVEIMLAQLKYLLGIGEDEFSDIMQSKLDEQIKEIKNGLERKE